MTDIWNEELWTAWWNREAKERKDVEKLMNINYDDSARLIAKLLHRTGVMPHDYSGEIGASPQNFFPENLTPDTGDKNVSEKTDRNNAGKPELSFVLEFEAALDELARVCELGAVKYARGNWKKGGPNTTTESFYDAALRHMKKRLKGEMRDVELDTLHSAQAAWNLLADVYWTLRREEDTGGTFIAPGAIIDVETKNR